MDVNAFKAQWKYLLKERGLTQDKLAIELYVDSSLISKWVNGREPFPDWAKRRITQLLRLSEEETADLFSSLVHGLSRQEEDGLPSAKIMADFSQMPEPEFLSRLLLDYEGCLDRFFDQKTGAVREHLRDDGSPAFLYSEVTGYAIHDLVILYKITGNTEYLAKAQKAGNWLIDSASHPSGWIHPRFYFEKDSDPSLSLYSFAGGNFFAFDNGICLSGLIDLYQVTRDIAIYQRAKTLADNFVKLVKADGSICAIFDAQGQEIQVPQPRWSQQSRSFHTKIAAALADMNSIDPNEKYIETARSMCHHAMTFQAEDGRFITDEYGNTQLHPHCYSAEGLLHVGLALDELAFIESAYRATAWAIDQMRDGEIPQEISSTGIVNWYPRTDALAQVLSLGARFQQLGILKESRWEALNNLMTCLLSKKDPEEKLFQFGTYENGQAAHTVNYWTNMFAFHSLLEYLAAWVCQNSVLVILAGGIGSRCWPISCENMPKPLSKGFLGDRSLLEETAGRFLRTGCVLPQNIVVVVSPTGLDEARRQLQKLKIPPENLVLCQASIDG